MSVVTRSAMPTLASALLLLATAPVEGAPPELQSLQDAYNKKVAEVTAPAAETFTNDLQKIANSYATRGSYQEAADVKSKGTATLAFLDSLKISASSTVILALAEASTIGQVSYSADTETLGRFTTENSRARWEIRQIKPGTYDVSLTYSVNHEEQDDADFSSETEEAGGTFTIREDTQLQRSDSGANSITHEVTSTGGWDTYRTEIIGSITLASASATIVLEAIAPKTQGLMQLRDFRLTPQRDLPADQAPADQSSEKLASLKRAHEERKIQIIAPITDAFTAEITSLKNAAEAAGDEKATNRLSKALHFIGSSTGDVKPSSFPPLTLAAVDDLKVQLAGTTTPNASRNFLGKLGPGGEGAITWQLPTDRPDTRFYEISIRQRPTTRSGGRLVVTAGSNQISYYLARPNEIQLENPDFRDTILGTLEIPSSAAAIQLRVKSLDPDSDTLADLESLTLQPLDDDFAAKKAITKQDRRTQELLESSDDGWKTIEGVTFSPSDSARASRFQIKTTTGETQKIILYGINSPPPKYSDNELEELESLSIKFSLDQGELERIGRKAIKFVEETLATGNCVVHTRGIPLDDGILATIVTADGSTLSVDLAGEGLANDSFWYGDYHYPEAIHPDMNQKVYGRWIKDSVSRAKSGNKGLWENWQ